MTTASPRADKAEPTGGLLKPYKPGQGFWTRLGTGLGATLIILFTIYFLYGRLPTWVRSTTTQTVSQTEAAAMEEQARGDSSLRVLAAESVPEGVRVKYEQAWLSRDSVWLYAVLGGVALVMAMVAWWLINRPKHAEFLIATDGEMKKVNWTSWQELMGSTKVVVFFMFFVAFMLFMYDIIFGYLFYFMNVLKIAPLTA